MPATRTKALGRAQSPQSSSLDTTLIVFVAVLSSLSIVALVLFLWDRFRIRGVKTGTLAKRGFHDKWPSDPSCITKNDSCSVGVVHEHR